MGTVTVKVGSLVEIDDPKGEMEHFMRSCIALYRETGAVNYLSMLFVIDDSPGEEYEVVIQRKAGLTPTQKLAVVEFQRDQLQAELTKAQREYSRLLRRTP